MCLCEKEANVLSMAKTELWTVAIFASSELVSVLLTKPLHLYLPLTALSMMAQLLTFNHLFLISN